MGSFLFVGCLLSVIGFRFSVVGCRLSVVGCRFCPSTALSGRWGDLEMGRLGDGETWRLGDFDRLKAGEAQSEIAVFNCIFLFLAKPKMYRE